VTQGELHPVSAPERLHADSATDSAHPAAGISAFTELELRAVLAASSDVILVLDADGRCLKAAGGRTDRLARTLVGRTLGDILGPDIGERGLACVAEVLRSGAPAQFEHPLALPLGVRRYNARIHPMSGIAQVLWIARDVTEHRAADAALAQRYDMERRLGRLSAQFINIAPERIDAAIDRALAEMGQHFQVERAYIYRLVDQARYMVNSHGWHRPDVACQLGYRKLIPSEQFPWLLRRLLSGRPIELIDIADLPSGAEAERRIFAERGVGSVVAVPITFSGEVHGFIGFDSAQPGRVWTADQVHFLRAAGEVFASALQRKHHEETIFHLAFYDELTGLPNRTRLRALLQNQLKTHDGSLTVALLDLDESGTVNDLLGHDVGDAVLRAASQRLQSLLPTGQLLGRWGGDEFLLTMPGEWRADELAQRVREALDQPVLIAGQELRLSCCTGIACYPDDATEVEGLIRFAEMALFHAKQSGPGSAGRYSHALKESAARRSVLRSRLRRAVDNGDFELHYQPLVRPGDHRIVSAEALARWTDAELGPVRPDQFIPIAEEAGLIVPLGEWVLQSACAELSRWPTHEGTPPRLSVNVSGLQLRDTRLATTLENALQRYRLQPEQLVLEITESALMERNAAGELPLLQRLRELGIGIAVDDFGTGHSSLSKLKHMPVTVLKIDRSFIQDIFTDVNDRAIVIAILAMAKQLQLSVVAEGVEAGEQLAFLQQHGCDLIQGYVYSRPLAAPQFRALWQRGVLTPGAD